MPLLPNAIAKLGTFKKLYGPSLLSGFVVQCDAASSKPLTSSWLLLVVQSSSRDLGLNQAQSS